MSKPFIRYLFWLLKLDLVIAFAALTAIFLLHSTPMTASLIVKTRPELDVPVIVMSLFGLVIAFRVFYDVGGTHTWLATRGLTRRQEFQSRILAGVAMIGLLVAWSGFLQISGLRQLVQQAMGSPWFPMVRWYETAVLPLMLIWGLVPFSFLSLMLSAVGTRGSNQNGLWIVLSVVATLIVHWQLQSAYEWASMPLWTVIALTLVSILIATNLASISERQAS